MGINFTYRKGILFFLCIFIFSGSIAQIPEGYYDNAEGKMEAELKTALHQIIRDHIILDYDVPARIWWNEYFRETDWHPDEYFWDMYSTDKKPTYGGGQNREHCMPRSWWGITADYSMYDANGDLHNLQPSNATANEAKSNYPLGIVPNPTFNNGVSKVGQNSFPGYYGLAYEPADEYKGDFARTYMYMVTCYEDYYANWRNGSMIIVSNDELAKFPTFNSYGINLLMQWHMQDPVSEKEINRNNAVYRIQQNRNPFIDRPAFAHLIWAPDIEIEINLSVYPNPTSSYLLVDFDNAEFDNFHYNIYSLNGILMQQEEVTVGSQITVSGLDNGLYILVIYAGNIRVTEKFVVSKSLSN